jgi:hypothetical protein
VSIEIAIGTLAQHPQGDEMRESHASVGHDFCRVAGIGRSYTHIQVYGLFLDPVQAEYNPIKYLVSLMVNNWNRGKILALNVPHSSLHGMGDVLGETERELIAFEAEMPRRARTVRVS